LEKLIKIALADGTFIEFLRDDDKGIHVCRDNFCVILPEATGKITTELFALLEPLGKIEEEEANES